ncbi:MAG: hypothetical protein ABI346_01945, partial [Candidatus Baltobacteraceae bacterium]
LHFTQARFSATILDFILSDRDEGTGYSYFVGSAFVQPGVIQDSLPNERMHCSQTRWEIVRGVGYVISRTRLYGDRGMPVYDTVVGVIEPSDLKELTTATAIRP